MKLKTLMQRLREVQKCIESYKEDTNVYLIDENGDAKDFSGFSVDDINDVSLYIVAGDKDA